MHSRGRGNSHSNKPLKPQAPTWVRLAAKEVEMLIGKLSKEGKTASQIGITLRDSYGIPSVKLVCGKRIQQILADKKLLGELPEDLLALMKHSVYLRKHLESNKHDMPALRGLQLTESKIKRLAKFYKANDRLAPTWKYDPEAAKMYA